MRIVPCALGVAACLVASRAEADVSKAVAAARANLPAETQLFVAIDVAAISKSPLAQKVIDAIEAEDRDVAKAHAMIKGACGWDPVTVIDGVVIAADAKSEIGMAYIQLKIDQKKAIRCLEQALALTSKGRDGKISVKQNGNVTIASKGNGKHDTAYFPWVGDNVVAVSIKPDRKEAVDAWFGQKSFTRSPAAALFGKLDPKAVFSGVFALPQGKYLDEDYMPIGKAYGNLTMSGGKLSGQLVATTRDAKSASKIAGELNKELARDQQRKRTPASVKKIMAAVRIAARGNELSIRGTTSERDFGAALAELVGKQKGSSEVDAHDPDMAKVVATFTKLSEQMCACKTKACAEKINEDMTKWATDMAKKTSSNTQPDAATSKQMAEVAERYTNCMMKMMQ